jgi:DUF917 family protein
MLLSSHLFFNLLLDLFIKGKKLMRQFTADDLESLSLGSAVLGSGGGGDTTYAQMMVKHQLEQYGPINVISVDELKTEDLVVPISLMGAPLITSERIINGQELENLIETIDKRLNLKTTVLMGAEIGGANAFTPLLIAAKLGLPVLDADMIGRAFPELQMSSCYLQNLKATPAVVADCLGNTTMIETSDAQTLEKIARSITVAMGSSSAVGFYFMNGLQAKQAVIPDTFSLAINIGSEIKKAVEQGLDPTEVMHHKFKAVILGRGTLIDIDQSIQGGFLTGSVTILSDFGKIKLFYQNEYLLACKNKRPLASTPDLLVIMEEISGTPISSETLRYGLQVALIAIPAHSIWQTSQGLSLVGPRIFGYNIDYKPIQSQ